MKTFEQIAQAMYKAYRAAHIQKLADWHQLTQMNRDCWMDAAKAKSLHQEILAAATMDNQGQEALRLAEKIKWGAISQDSSSAAKELRRLHARVEELEAMLESVGAGGVSAQRVTQSPTLKASSGWLIDGGLLYRLNDEGTNCDEINVTMAGNSRTEAARVERAEEILNMLLRAEANFKKGQTELKRFLLAADAGITNISSDFGQKLEKKKLDFSSAPAAMLRIKAIQKAADHIEREGFEAWWRENVSQGLAEIDHDYRYWAIWQARAALDADHIAQDRKMVAVPVEVPKVGSAWRHKNGNAYRVVAIANECNAHFSGRYPVTVVYQGENGKMWARRADDWHRSMTHDATAPSTAPVVLPEPDAWAAVHFSGKRAGKIYTTCDTKEQIEAYIHQVHQSNDSITLRAEPIYMRAAPQPQAGAPVALPEHGINTASHDGYMNGEQPMKAKSHNTYIVGVIADKIEDGTLFDSGIYRRREIAEIVRNLLSTVTEFQADALDAQRYRWLRAQPLGNDSSMFCTTIWRKGSDGFGDDLRLEKLDAAIDAAIAAAKEMK